MEEVYRRLTALEVDVARLQEQLKNTTPKHEAMQWIGQTVVQVITVVIAVYTMSA